MVLHYRSVPSLLNHQKRNFPPAADRKKPQRGLSSNSRQKVKGLITLNPKWMSPSNPPAQSPGNHHRKGGTKEAEGTEDRMRIKASKSTEQID